METLDPKMADDANGKTARAIVDTFQRLHEQHCSLVQARYLDAEKIMSDRIARIENDVDDLDKRFVLSEKSIATVMARINLIGAGMALVIVTVIGQLIARLFGHVAGPLQ